MNLKTALIIFFAVCCGASVANSVKTEIQAPHLDYQFGRQLIEQGRTLVHHTLKRFMVILPAIFFKLGIAFTLLILVALAAVNNGFIGFLLLVVGMSSVLARFQESRTAAVPVPYISPIPSYHHNVWDRSDSSVDSNNLGTKALLHNAHNGGYGGYSPQLNNYYAKYSAAKV